MGIDCTYFKHLKLKSLFLKHPVSGDQQFKKQKFAPPTGSLVDSYKFWLVESLTFGLSRFIFCMVRHAQ